MSPYVKNGQGIPVGGERVPRADERVTDTPIPLFRVPQEHQVNNCNTKAEDLVQTHAGL